MTSMSFSPEPSGFEIVTYRHAFREAFKGLNLPWLEAHGLLEPIDLDYLDDPEGKVLAGGGQIFFALRGETILGTAAAIRTSSRAVELAKLGVAPAARGQGIGRALTEAVLAFAREGGAAEVTLSTNTALVEAIHLYESMGFRHAPMPAEVRYATANVYMTYPFPQTV